MKKWILDTSYSEVVFKVRHLLISTVSGTFNELDGYVASVDDTFSLAQFHLTVKADSINTRVEQRDIHLKSADFFNVSAFPFLTFQSTSGIQNNKTTGILTLKGISREITLNATLGGVIVDPYANKRAGIELTGKINRSEFGIDWNEFTHNGTLVIGNEIAITVNLEFIEII